MYHMDIFWKLEANKLKHASRIISSIYYENNMSYHMHTLYILLVDFIMR